MPFPPQIDSAVKTITGTGADHVGQRCETCRFRDSVEERRTTETHCWPDGKTGSIVTVRAPYHICRRHGPIAINDYGITRMQWPPVELSDWCGEWRQREGVSHE